MSPWGAFGITAAVLLAPWVLMPRRESGEMRGLVRLLWWLNALYCHAWHRLEIKSSPPLPERGPALLICNHTCAIDHMLLQAATRRLLGFMIAQELYDYWLFHPFVVLSRCIPVKRDGRDLSATRAALRALGEGRVVPIFPEGRIYPTSGRVLGEGKPGVAFIAIRAGVPVIPAYIHGTPATSAIVRSYLTPSHARVSFGPPVDLADLARGADGHRPDLDQVTERLMGAIRRLRDEALGTLQADEAAVEPVSEEAVDAPGPSGNTPALSRSGAAL